MTILSMWITCIELQWHIFSKYENSKTNGFTVQNMYIRSLFCLCLLICYVWLPQNRDKIISAQDDEAYTLEAGNIYITGMIDANTFVIDLCIHISQPDIVLLADGALSIWTRYYTTRPGRVWLYRHHAFFFNRYIKFAIGSDA